MKLNGMTFKENEEGDTVPSTVSVTMTLEEALWVAKVSGQQRGESPHYGIYQCLTSDVFNPYWDDGVDDAIREYQVETPPIVYED